LLITDLNQAWFIKMSTCRVQEVTHMIGSRSPLPPMARFFGTSCILPKLRISV